MQYEAAKKIRLITQLDKRLRKLNVSGVFILTGLFLVRVTALWYIWEREWLTGFLVSYGDHLQCASETQAFG